MNTSVVSKLIYKSDVIPPKITSRIFTETRQLDPNKYMKKMNKQE